MNTATTTATTELRRFLTITGRRFDNGQSAPEMFSPALDAAWHVLLGTPQYVRGPQWTVYHAACSADALVDARKNADRRWRPVGEPVLVKTHDFLDRNGLGTATCTGSTTSPRTPAGAVSVPPTTIPLGYSGRARYRHLETGRSWLDTSAAAST